jgi:hypothetical protein
MYFCIRIFESGPARQIITGIRLIKNVFCKNHNKMKKIKFFLLLSSLLLVVPLIEAQSTEVSAEIISALNEGNSSQLSAFLNANVELVIDNKNDVFSKQQASGIIADFFRKNHVNSFQLLHKGNKDLASFAIGMLKTSDGNYRVYVLTRKNEIQQLRIEPSND